MSKDRQARVSEAAYRIWQREGFPEGRDIEHWLEAEREVYEAEQREADGKPQDKAGDKANDNAPAAAQSKAASKPQAETKPGAKPSAKKAGGRKVETSGSSK